MALYANLFVNECTFQPIETTYLKGPDFTPHDILIIFKFTKSIIWQYIYGILQPNPFQ